MSIEMYAFLIGIILILVDFFFVSDIPTFAAILLFCWIFYRQLFFSQLVNVIFTIIFFFVVLIAYIAVWRKTKTAIIDKWFAKDVYKAGVYGFTGKTGVVRVVDGNKYALIDGDLYAFYDEVAIPEETKFTVKEVKDGKIVIM